MDQTGGFAASSWLVRQVARASVFNGRGPWWNSGSSHMNDAFRKRYFDKLGLYSLVDGLQCKQRITT